MHKMKATDIVVLKKLFKELDGSLEAAYIEALPPQWREIYDNVIFTTKLPIDMVDQMYHLAAGVLYPGAADKYIKFGKRVSEKSFSSVYKIFMRIPTRKFVISRAPAVWQSYHEKGQASIENLTALSGDFVVANYPELPRVLRLVAGGHLVKMLELVGTRNVHVEHLKKNPQEWRWHISWQV
ncbi:hypothetical protein K8S19_07900 [bacterium]|nr:hypothetical protein [bacterium]